MGIVHFLLTISLITDKIKFYGNWIEPQVFPYLKHNVHVMKGADSWLD